jgi:hypothetical protein
MANSNLVTAAQPALLKEQIEKKLKMVFAKTQAR